MLRRPADGVASLVATTSSLNVAFLTLVALSADKLAWSDGAGGGTLTVKNGRADDRGGDRAGSEVPTCE